MGANSSGAAKLRILVAGALVALAAGHALDLTGITPIIKRIATSSFVLVTGGYCLLFLALCYWWIDLRQHRALPAAGQSPPKDRLRFFTIVGMNSIFIYLFFEIVGHRWFNDYIRSIGRGLLQLTGMALSCQNILSCVLIFALEWELCYFLYRKKIFFRL